MKQIKNHLTYANAMSSLAIFLILGGAGAYAAKKSTQKIGTTQIKASAVTVGKLKNGAVATAKLHDGAVTSAKLQTGAVTNGALGDGSVSTAKLQGDAVTGEKVNESTLGEVPSANSANPTVFARVNSSGSVDGANSKGLTSVNVSKPPLEFGVYCITVPTFTPHGGQVTTERSGGAATTGTLGINGGPSCPAPKVEVETFIGTNPGDVGFYVEFYR